MVHPSRGGGVDECAFVLDLGQGATQAEERAVSLLKASTELAGIAEVDLEEFETVVSSESFGGPRCVAGEYAYVMALSQ